MAAPTNISALTAIDLGSTLPATASQNVFDAGTTYDVFYSYTAGANDYVLGLFGFGDLTTYKPDTSVFIGPASSPVPWFIQDSGNNACVYFPVTPFVTYYFKFTTNAGNPTPAELSISLITFTGQDVPVGSIAVNDDQTGFPLALLSSAAGELEVLNYIPPVFANGETMADLDNGTIAIFDAENDTVQVYGSNFVAGAAVPIDPFSAGSVLTSNRVDAFYGSDHIGGGSPVFIKRFLVNGTVTDTTSAITLSGGLDAIGVSPDESVLYYYGNAATNTPIKRWDLVNDVALTDLVTLVGRACRDFVMLADGNLVIGNSTADTLDVIHGTTGATVASYSLGTDLNSEDRMTRGLTDATVWVWNKIAFPSPGSKEEQFTEYRLSNGVILNTVHGESLFGAQGTAGEAGCYLAVPIADPLRFGNSDSCPFWITRVLVPPPFPEFMNGPEALEAFEAAGLLKAFDVPRVRTVPHLADENQRLFYSKFQLDLEAGVGTVTGQGVDPVVLLRYSNDGGFTWSAWRQLSVGALGIYKWRCIAWRLGMARDRVFQIRQTDPVKTAWLTAYIEFEGGDA